MLSPGLCTSPFSQERVWWAGREATVPCTCCSHLCHPRMSLDPRSAVTSSSNLQHLSALPASPPWPPSKRTSKIQEALPSQRSEPSLEVLVTFSFILFLIPVCGSCIPQLLSLNSPSCSSNFSNLVLLYTKSLMVKYFLAVSVCLIASWLTKPIIFLYILLSFF